MRRRFRAEKIAAVLSRILFLLFEDDGIAASYLPDFVIFRCFLAITEGIGYCQLDVLTIGGIVICLVVDVVSRVHARGIADKRFSERTSERKTHVQPVPRPCSVQVVVGRIPLVRYGRMVNAGCGISGGNLETADVIRSGSPASPVSSGSRIKPAPVEVVGGSVKLQLKAAA